MRWIVAGLFALVAAWGVYLLSPYYMLYRLGRAVETGDVEAVAARVNVRALRSSVAKQVAAELAATEPDRGIATADAQLVASAALALADPVLESFVRPDGVLRLLRISPAGDATGTAFGKRSVGIEDLDDFLPSSSWRGFRNVYVHLPPGEPPGSRYRVQLRLGNWRWRLVAIDLPPRLIRRLAADLRSRSTR